MRILIDTCVIIDAILDRKPFNVDAQALLLACAKGHAQGYITANSVTDIHYLTSKFLHDEKAIRNILANLFKSIKILDTIGLDCMSAIYSEITDYEDAVQAETAHHNDIDLIVTRDLKDYQLSPVPVCSPAECLEKIGVDSWG